MGGAYIQEPETVVRSHGLKTLKSQRACYIVELHAFCTSRERTAHAVIKCDWFFSFGTREVRVADQQWLAGHEKRIECTYSAPTVFFLVPCRPLIRPVVGSVADWAGTRLLHIRRGRTSFDPPAQGPVQHKQIPPCFPHPPRVPDVAGRGRLPQQFRQPSTRQPLRSSSSS